MRGSGLETLLPQIAGENLVGFVLVLARVGGIFLLAPVFSSRMIPVRAKLVAAGALAFALAPLVFALAAWLVFQPLMLGLAAWSLGLLLLGLRVVYRWSYSRSAAGVGLTVVWLAALAVGLWSVLALLGRGV